MVDDGSVDPLVVLELAGLLDGVDASDFDALPLLLPQAVTAAGEPVQS